MGEEAGEYRIDWEQSLRGKAAMDYFYAGYNCTQAVVLAFSDLFDMDKELLLRMSSSFGGGMGRLREVCGTVSGMFIVAGLLYGYDDPKAFDEKALHYGRIQELARRFRACQGSIVCRELLGLTGQPGAQTAELLGLAGQPGAQLAEVASAYSSVPERRTPEYYKKRPCPQLAGLAAAILEQFIAENPVAPQK